MKNYPVSHNLFGLNLFDENPWDSLFRPLFDGQNMHMRTDIKEVGDRYQMDVDMPGFSKENIELSLNDGCLTVSASQTEKQDETEKNGYIRRERAQTCSRTYEIGDVNESDITATYDKGILQVTFPKAPTARGAKKVQVL